MGKRMYQRCDQKHDCLHCKHPDCIEGEPITKELTAGEEAKNFINKKYYRNPKAVERKREIVKKYRSKHMDRVYESNRKYAKAHPEIKKRISRKYARLKALANGTAKIVGTAMINGKETIIYGSRYGQKNNYWYLFGKTYGEIEEEEVTWLWIKKEVSDGKV